MDILDEVTRVSISLLLREPYYAHIFSCINKHVVDAQHPVSTMAVGLQKRNHVLYINPRFWTEELVEKEHRMGVIKHEILHIILKHTLVKQQDYDRHLMNIAMDLVVNQLIERSQLPDESIFLETFPDLDLQPDMSWTYYYHKLVDLQNGLDGAYRHTASAANFRQIERGSHGLDRHTTWYEIQELDQLEQSLLESGVDYLIVLAHGKTSHKSWGSLPAHLRRLLEKIIHPTPPVVDWRKALKLFSESSRKTYIKSTLKRASRRYGTIPGIKVRRKQKLLVAIDTSASVSNRELSRFFQELSHIYRSGSEIRIVECDVELQRQYDYHGVIPEFVKGGGGTDFEPPLAYGNTTYHPDGLIYFTDGFAPAPAVRARFPLLWIICGQGLTPEDQQYKSLPGRKVKMYNTD